MRESCSTSSDGKAERERILVIEDERPMRVALEDCLSAEGYRVISAADGPSGLDRVLKEKPDLILMDVMMPGLDGFSLCAELRRLGYVGQILMLTAKGQVQDRVEGLDSGADDYLVKPFSTEELLARIRASMRRARQDLEEKRTVKIGSSTFDFTTLTAEKSGRAMHLTRKEWEVLKLLVQAKGGVVSRDLFLDRVWGFHSFPTTRTVDNHVAMLRNKIEEDPRKPTFLVTVHKSGYRLVLE